MDPHIIINYTMPIGFSIKGMTSNFKYCLIDQILYQFDSIINEYEQVYNISVLLSSYTPY